MTEVVKWFFDAFWHAFSVVNDALSFDFFGRELSFLQLLLGFLVLGILTTVFWRGAKS